MMAAYLAGLAMLILTAAAAMLVSFMVRAVWWVWK